MAGSGNYNETTMTTSSTSAKLGSLDRKTNYEDLFGVTPNKRFHSDEVWNTFSVKYKIFIIPLFSLLQNFLLNACNFPSTHLKISSKGMIYLIFFYSFIITTLQLIITFCHYYNLDGRTLDGQLTVSMEINGILYHGILFAQTNNTNNRNNRGNK